MCDKNYSFFVSNLSTLVNQYTDKYVVIKDEAIIGIYDSFKSAFDETKKTEELGTFLIQFCSDDPQSDVNYFYSNNVVFA